MQNNLCLSGYITETIASVKEFIDSHPLEWKTTDQLAAEQPLTASCYKNVLSSFIK